MAQRGGHAPTGEAKHRGGSPLWYHAKPMDGTLERGRMSRCLKLAFACLVAAAMGLVPLGGLAGCDGGAGGGSAGGSGGAGSPTGAAWAQPADVALPNTTIAAGSTAIDTSGTSQGWVAAAAVSPVRLKFQVITDAGTYNYDLPSDGTPTIYPLNMGNGSYTFRIMQNTEGNSYVPIATAKATVKLSTEFAPFLMPGMFCSYTDASDCVAKARELTADCTNEGEVVATICTWVAKHVSYDTAKAKRLATATGYVPEPDETLATGKGICFDYASLSTAMLRSLGLPTRLMTGYVGEDAVYHAWIMVYIDGTWQTAKFSVSPNEWSRCDVTFASTGATAYVGDASAYTDRYTY